MYQAPTKKATAIVVLISLLATIVAALIMASVANAHSTHLRGKPPARAHVKSLHRWQVRNLRYVSYVCSHGRGHAKHWACHTKKWLAVEVRETAVKKRSSINVDSCLRIIIGYEGSNWNPRATNPSSGAYGIPQALPGSKMASAGSDWATNPVTQIRWMIGYVNARYGGSCSALAFWNSNHYY